MNKYLITGAHGMAGSHLVEHVVETSRGTVAGIARSDTGHEFTRDVRLYTMDLLDYSKVKHCLEEFRPDYIFHLAAKTFVPDAWQRPQDTHSENAVAEMNLFQAVVETGLNPVIHVASSGVVHGRVAPSSMPISEDTPLNPADPYALSKVTQEFVARQYANSHGLRTIVTRTFNHTGPRRPDRYVESSFAHQLVEIEYGLREPIVHVGELSAKRDFMDVRDVVRAYVQLAESGTPGETYLIGSGRPVSIAELLDTMIDLTGLSVKIVRDPGLVREIEVPILYGTSEKLRRTVDWQPRYALEDTLRDLLSYWRTALLKSTASSAAPTH